MPNTFITKHILSPNFPARFGAMSEPWDCGIGRDLGVTNPNSALDKRGAGSAGKGISQNRCQVRDTARTHTGVSELPRAPGARGSLCLWGKEAVVDRGGLLGGGRPQSCPGRKGEVGQGKQDSEGGGSPPRCRAVTSSGTRSCSNHMLRAGLAALNDDPRKGLSSCRGFDTSLPGGLCWAVMSSPEQFRTGRGEIEWKRLGPLLS